MTIPPYSLWPVTPWTVGDEAMCYVHQRHARCAPARYETSRVVAASVHAQSKNVPSILLLSLRVLSRRTANQVRLEMGVRPASPHCDTDTFATHPTVETSPSPANSFLTIKVAMHLALSSCSNLKIGFACRVSGSYSTQLQSLPEFHRTCLPRTRVSSAQCFLNFTKRVIVTQRYQVISMYHQTCTQLFTLIWCPLVWLATKGSGGNRGNVL